MTDPQLAARLRDVLSETLFEHRALPNDPSRHVPRKMREVLRANLEAALLPLLSSLLEEREREIREALEDMREEMAVVTTRAAAAGPNTVKQWRRDIQVLLSRLASSSSPAAPQEE